MVEFPFSIFSVFWYYPFGVYDQSIVILLTEYIVLYQARITIYVELFIVSYSLPLVTSIYRSKDSCQYFHFRYC